jgi:hypothetical protein
MFSWAFACEPENMAPTLNQEEPSPLAEEVLNAAVGVLLNQEEPVVGLADVLLNQEEPVLAVEGPNQEGPPLKKEELDVAALCGALTNNGLAACWTVEVSDLGKLEAIADGTDSRSLNAFCPARVTEDPNPRFVPARISPIAVGRSFVLLIFYPSTSIQFSCV